MAPLPPWLSDEIDEVLRVFRRGQGTKRHVAAWLYSYERDLTCLPRSELHRLILDAGVDAASPLSDELARSYGL